MKKEVERRQEEGRGLLRDGVHTNNERFNQMLNRCRHPRRVYSMLMTFIEPGVEQSDYMFEKRKILIGNLLAGLNVSESDKQII